MVGTQLRELNLRLVGLARVLSDRSLAVPRYQRSYSWKTEQVDAFWSDLQATMLSGVPDYFMGTIVLASEGAKDDDRQRRITVIDGQQRLATVSILIACMRDALVAADESSRASVLEQEFLLTADLRSGRAIARLELNSEDSEYFRSTIVERRSSASTNEPPSPQSSSNYRLLAARERLGELLQSDLDAAGPSWMNRIFDWIEFLQERVRVISIRVETEADAFLIFETLNDRGLGLTIADLLKNHLLSLANEQSEDVQGLWLSMIGAFPAEPEHDDNELVTTFIRHYWSSIHGPTRERELYQSLKRRVRSSSQAADLVRNLAQSAPSYAALLDPEHERWLELEIPKSLSDTVLRFALEQPRPLLLAAMDTLPLAELANLLAATIAWSTRGLIVGGIGGGTTERYYSNAAEAVRSGRARTTQDIASILEPIIPTDDVFLAAFREKRVNSPRLAKYYLAAIESGEVLPNFTDQHLQSLSVLHVLPRRADPEAWPSFPKESINQWALRLGNQAIIEQEFAVSMPRVPTFQDKVRLLRMSTLQSAQQFARCETWGPAEVDEIQELLAVGAAHAWPRLV